MTYEEKVAELEKYEYKQKLIGKVFDFEVINDDVYLTKYYDIHGRTEVTIPDFVDYFKTEHDYSKAIELFSDCKFVNKVVMHSNVKGYACGLFRGYSGSYLDLSDFDTSNITDMSSMFSTCYTDKLVLNDKFVLNKADSLSFMFSSSTIRDLILGESFDTSNATGFQGMFEYLETDSLNIGVKFHMDNAEFIEYMFLNTKTDRIYLGDNFNTLSAHWDKNIFEESTAKQIVIGKYMKNDMVERLKKLTKIPIITE